MPILAAEPFVYPERLLEDSDPQDGRNWWAVHTKPRQEKALARQLHSLDLAYYLPLIPKTSVIRGKRVKSLIPLFGSYVFFFGNDEERLLALQTKRITMTIAAPETIAMTKSLRDIQAVIDSGAALTVEGRLGPGRRVRVINGALLGVEGVITERRGLDHLLIDVQFLQQGVSVLIQDFLVKPVHTDLWHSGRKVTGIFCPWQF